jgi:hypothetical protein
MNQVRIRFIGGPLNGQAVWIDQDRSSLSVQVAPGGGGPHRTLEYRRDGEMLVYVEPTETREDE